MIMKKVLLNFTEGLLSREQMRVVTGGVQSLASATATCIGVKGTFEVTCTGGSSCSSEDDPDGTGGYCECDGKRNPCHSM